MRHARTAPAHAAATVDVPVAAPADAQAWSWPEAPDLPPTADPGNPWSPALATPLTAPQLPVAPLPAADRAPRTGRRRSGKGGPSPEDSDSEFELTLDDSSDLALQGEGSPQVKAGTDDDAPAQDIFESDFDIPAIQEEGSGEPATVDNELESSDFDIALDDSELAADEESGSQVVALDEEEVQVEEEVEVTEGDFEGLEGEEIEVQEEYDTRPPRVEVHEKILKPAPWGPVPVIAGFPCVIVMLLMGFVGFELVQSSVAHRPPGMMTRLLNDNILHPIGFSPKLGKS